MSLIPADESGADGRGGEQGDDDAGSASLVRRAVARVGDALRRVGRALRAALPTRRRERDGHRAVDGERLPDRRGPAALAERFESEQPSDATLATEPSSRVRALPAGDAASLEGPTADAPELTARREGDELTIEVPDEPGATITSDVWEDVER